MFGTVAPKPVPLASIALFGTRDSMTIGASFNLPVLISARMQQRYGYSAFASDTSAQLLTPIGMQIFSTPLHLLGMDLYNNPANSVAQRVAFIKREYLKTLLARWGRIFPAFGLGGLTNKAVRKRVNYKLAAFYKKTEASASTNR